MPKARVLAVDDQPYFRERIEGLRVDAGYEVVTAASGEEALHVLEREDFDIVITDLAMPGIDGSQFVQRIKQRSPEPEIVMLTAIADVQVSVAAMKQGASDYLLKPFEGQSLFASLDRILAHRRLRDDRAAAALRRGGSDSGADVRDPFGAAARVNLPRRPLAKERQKSSRGAL
jgi:DNA-binding NtrC family response regulator